MKLGLFAAAAALAASLCAATDYSKIGVATADAEGDAPLGTAWHAQHMEEVNEATTDDALAAFVDSGEAADELLSRIKPGYQTDPLDAIRIGAVTQYVMANAGAKWYEFWKSSRSGERAVWVGALVKALSAAKDEYVAIFLLDQLRWCADEGKVEAIKGAAAHLDSKNVATLLAQVVRELKRECPGL